jgi:hypothetical protein
MARKKREKEKVDPFERARLKKLRAAERREERKRRRAEAAANGEDISRRRRGEPAKPVGIETDQDKVAVRDPHDWIRRSITMAFAWKIVNLYSTRDLPYWLSIDGEMSNPPTSGYYPCHMYRKNGRYYYGFLFRQCRDAVFEKWQHEYAARKELTPQQS